jgi:hypothetical protein
MNDDQIGVLIFRNRVLLPAALPPHNRNGSDDQAGV